MQSTPVVEKVTETLQAPEAITANSAIDDYKKTPSDVPSGSEESKCPMHREDGSYSYDWWAIFRPNFPHGPGGSKPISDDEAKAKITRRASIMDPNLAVSGAGGCPVQQQHYVEYNVYSQPIDPSNNMPQNPNQLPAPGQARQLSTERIKSNIPKGGASEEGTTWTYPSPQMFYNALVRKGKLDDTSEEEIDSVVALHNNMNEKTWKKVLEWEETVAPAQNEAPKLLKFMGRPKDLSPKAWIKHNVLGHPLPFDRHDWTVLRSDGTTVRYVIDYYYDESRAQDDGGGMPEKDDLSATPSLLVDVRPALDGPEQFLDRAIRMPYATWTGKTKYEFMPLYPTSEMRDQVQESMQVWKSIQSGAASEKSITTSNSSGKKPSAEELHAFTNAVKGCKKAQINIDNCQSDDDCAKASLDYTLCMGKELCPLQHNTFTKTLSKEDDDSRFIDVSLERLSECVVMKSRQQQ